VEWVDAMGRMAMIRPIRHDGPSAVVDRHDLPSGLYTLRAVANDRIVGQVRVICD